MPQIKEYTAQVDTLRPSETGIEALAGAGRRAGAFYNQAAQSIKETASDQARAAMGVANAKEDEARSFGRTAKDFADLGEQVETSYAHHEISQGAAAFAQAHSQLTDQWNQVANHADPNDTSVAGKFREQTLEPALEQFRQSFQTTQGQQWAEGHIDALRQHFYDKIDADMSSRAGDAVAVNVRKSSNAWSNTARNDPSAVPFLLDSADNSVAGIVSSAPNLKGSDAARVRSQLTQKAKEDIVRAGALGAIEQSSDPEAAAAAFAKRYPEFVNAQEIDQFAKTARMFSRMNEAQGKAADAERHRQATAAFHKDANQWELSTIDENGNSVMPADGVKNLKDMVTRYGGDADPGRVTAMVHRVQELGKVLDPASAANLKKTSDLTERGIYSRMTTGQGEPVTDAQINEAYSEGQLSFAARNRLLKDIQADRSPDGESIAKSRTDFFRNFAATIDPGRDQATGFGGSALGSQKIGEATAEARRMEGVLRSQGKDPHSLYDPASPDYFGKPENIGRFRPTLAQKAAFEAQLKADQQGGKGPPPAPPAAAAAPERPKGFPPDAQWDAARKAWFVIQNGQRFRVEAQ